MTFEVRYKNMNVFYRVPAASFAAFKHMLICLLVAVGVGALVFGLWFPTPFGELAGGQDLFLLIVAVDVVCGPLLTLVIYNPRKPRAELVRDIGLVVLIQLAALGYGLYSLMQARPVWLAFEGDRFRVVSVPDVDASRLAQAPADLQTFSLWGPKPVGVRLVQSGDPEFLSSVMESLDGNHPSFRPERWVPFDQQRSAVAAAVLSLSDLMAKHPDQSGLIQQAVQRIDLPEEALGFLPLVAEERSDWVVLVRRSDGEPIDYLPLDGWTD